MKQKLAQLTQKADSNNEGGKYDSSPDAGMRGLNGAAVLYPDPRDQEDYFGQ